jgi:hypothetical protein
MKPESMETAVSAAPSPPAPRRRLHPAVWRLALVAALFAGWLGYLGYLVSVQSRPAASVVLSRPQLLVSELDVIAEVSSTSDNEPVTVKEVLYPQDAGVKAGDRLLVKNLKDCARLVRKKDLDQKVAEEEAQEARLKGKKGPKLYDRKADFTGPGVYLLPLREVAPQVYEVTPLPPAPGFPALLNEFGDTSPAGVGLPRIYPDSPEVPAQYRRIAKP